MTKPSLTAGRFNFGEVNHVRDFAVFGQQSVNVDDALDAVGHAIGHAGDDHAAVAVADEDDVVQIFPEDDVDDVLNVRVEVNVRAAEVGMFAEPGERRAINDVAVGGEQIVHVFPIPTAAPCAVHDDVGEFFAGGSVPRRRGRVRFAPGECGEAGQSQGQMDELFRAHFMWWKGGGMLTGCLLLFKNISM